MRYRIYVEVEYLIALSFEKKIEEFPALNKEQIEDIRKIYRNFNMESAKHIKDGFEARSEVKDQKTNENVSQEDEEILDKLKEKNLSPEDLKKIYEDLQKKK